MVQEYGRYFDMPAQKGCNRAITLRSRITWISELFNEVQRKTLQNFWI